MRCILTGLLCVCLAQTAVSTEEPVVDTKLGKYKGHYLSTFGGLQIVGFNGIRYAKPPKRFQEAENIAPHEGIYDALKDGDDCVQISHNYNKYPFEESLTKKIVGSEDCLFLNVYVPNLNPSKPYPVMVWIHGGGFMIGTGSKTWHGPELLLDKEVILVSLNYRLDVFGFLSLDDEVIPGNLGLKDQSLALHWVKENIAAFGGDPQSITIFGESAGAASVHFQMESPRNKDLFHKAISQSGSIDCPWAVDSISEARDKATKVASFLSCPKTPQEFLSCIEGKTVEEIIDASLSLKKMKVKMELIFKPVMESKSTGFITEKDLEERSNIPWLTGVNSGEGLILYTELCIVGDRSLSDVNAHYKTVMPGLFNYRGHPREEELTNLIKKQYMGNEEFNEKNAKKFVKLISDGMFIYGQLVSANKHQGKNYFYLLTHKGERSLTALNQLHHLKAGVCHADDMFYLFPFWKVYPKLVFNTKDTKVMKNMVDMWTNFATYGDPTPGKDQPKWFESEKGTVYANIKSEGIKPSKNLYITRMNFWRDIHTNFMNDNVVKDEL